MISDVSRYIYINSPLVVYEPLLAPAETVAHQTVGYPEAKHFLLVNGDNQGQGIADLYVLRRVMLRRIAAEDLHRASRHRSGRLRGGARQVEIYFAVFFSPFLSSHFILFTVSHPLRKKGDIF